MNEKDVVIYYSIDEQPQRLYVRDIDNFTSNVDINRPDNKEKQSERFKKID